MSTAPADYEHLLREAINQAKANAPRAIDDLFRFSSRAAEAVTKVTSGAAALELVPINQSEGANQDYQLHLRKVMSESPPSDLGVFRVSNAGYPVLRWFSRRNWEAGREPDENFPSDTELEGNFKWMISNPESRLVVLVTFFQQKEPSSPNSGGSAA